jgi:hypothetical protein
MWRNILPQALYQIVVMIILMFAGQAMFFETDFNIITEELYKNVASGVKDGDNKDVMVNVATDRLRKDVACFHTFMLMNIINMINCRVINENQNNVFKTLFKKGTFWFWAIFVVELVFQNGMIIAGEIRSGPFKFLPNVLGVCNDINWKIHLTAWIFGLFPLAIRPLTNKIDVKYFKFMDSIDLETKHGVNCVTKWADKAKEDLDRAN